MKMMFALSGLVFMAWGCVAIIGEHYGLGLYLPFGWAILIQRFLGPWATLWGGYILLKQARLWRHLESGHDEIQWLIRSPGRVTFVQIGPLERIAKAFLALGASALLYWFDVPEPELILLAALLVWFFKCFVFRILRRP